MFIDDVLIYANTVDEALCNLDEALTLLSAHNVYLKPSKCEFLLSQMMYLGHVVSGDGTHTDPS